MKKHGSSLFWIYWNWGGGNTQHTTSSNKFLSHRYHFLEMFLKCNSYFERHVICICVQPGAAKVTKRSV